MSIKDTGVGLAPHMLERIFDLFTQVDTSLARSNGGLGLGLTVVRRVLDMHGGHIEARSAGLGEGSEFIVRLPVLLTIPTSKSPGESLATAKSGARQRRVLIVDDNVDAGDSMAQLLGAWGHTVAVAREAIDALSQMSGFRPDTALVDIGLPGMDGYELARRLRVAHDGQLLKLIAVTGYGSPEDRIAAREAGFDVHLVKPVDLTDHENLLAAE